MHEKTLNQRFNENEARIRNLERYKLDALLFESELDHRDTIVNDIRILPDPGHERYIIEYTLTKPLSGEHEKKSLYINSPDHSIRIYQDAAGVHLQAVPNVDRRTIGYNENGALYSLTAEPDTDQKTIEYNENHALHVIDGSIGENQLSEAWKASQQAKADAVEQALEILHETKADKIFSLDPVTGTETVENLINVKQSLSQNIADTRTELLEEIGRVETDLDAAKEDKSPNDDKLYGLKNGGKVEITPDLFGRVDSVDGIEPNAAGEVYLDAAHRIHDPTTQKIYEAVPPGGHVDVIAFDCSATPAPSSAVEAMVFEDEAGNQFVLRNRADGYLVATHPDNTETVLWRPDYGWQLATYRLNATLVSHTPLTAEVWNYMFLTNTLDLVDVREAALQKAQADFNVVTSVVPRTLYDTTVLFESVKNPVTGIMQLYIRYIPLADEHNAGLMPRSLVTSLRLAKADIETLKGVGRVAAHLGLSPTQEDLDSAWKTGKNTQSITEGATVVNLDQEAPLGHAWTYLADTVTGIAEWVDRGTDIVNLATNEAPGVVQGTDGTDVTANQGKVSVENDGTMSVIGWDETIKLLALDNITADVSDYGTKAADSLKNLLLGAMRKIRGLFSFFTNGSANTAVKLLTPRTLTADPADTAPGSFDGSANVSIGVAPLLTDGTAASTLPTAGTATALTALLNTIRNCLKWLVARFDTAGNANTANKLTSSRTILTNLGSTSAADFDGSANVTPGVTGTLPIANGGTGTTTGKAPTADKLATPRTLTADPTDTAPGSFDGSANVSIGVAPLLTDGTAASTLPTAGTATALTALLNTIRNCLKWLVARFDTAGNANTANKLTSSRTILTNLGSTSAADFDGSANVTPGVTGTLPLGNVGFSTDQSNALNSGITSDKVAIYNSALADIGNKIDKITEIQAVGYKATEATAKSSSLTSTDTLFFYPEP